MTFKKVVEEFGLALWLDPKLQLNMRLTDMFMQLSRMDLVAVSSSLNFKHNSILYQQDSWIPKHLVVIQQ